MNEYIVTVPMKGWQTFSVKANSKAEAKRKVDNLDADIEGLDNDIMRAGKANKAEQAL